MSYGPDWHFDLIKNSKGVSLERISLKSNNVQNNWTSASSTSGYGTPGLSNSQSVNLKKHLNRVHLLRNYFSPNGDGVEDLLVCSYEMDGPDCFAQVTVFSKSGLLIKKIMNTGTLSTNGVLNWKGDMENGELAPPGIYILFFEYYKEPNIVGREKFAFTLLP